MDRDMGVSSFLLLLFDRHVWTAPVAQAVFGGIGDWSGAVMYSAFERGA